MLGVDEGGDPAVPLRLGHDVEGERGLPSALRPIDLHDAPAGDATDAEGEVERQRPGGDGRHLLHGVGTHLHHRAFAELTLDLRHGHLEGLLPFHLWAPSDAYGETLRTRCDTNYSIGITGVC